MIGLVVAIMTGTWASFLTGLITKEVEIWPFWLVFSAVNLGFAIRRKRIRMTGLFWVTVVGWGAFLIKLFSQMMVKTVDGIWAGGSNVWGDWAGHMGYVANWLFGANWPPQNPWYAGIRLSYPFLFDYTSAILAKSGLTIPWSMQIPGMVLGIIIVALLFRLTERLTKSAVAGALAVAIFMLSGGLGWIYLVPGQSVLPIPNGGVKELTHSYEANLQWVNFVISEMVPQRGILVGLAAALAIFLLWEMGWKNGDKNKFILAGIVVGMIPFFHAHAFLAIMGASGGMFLIKPKRIWWYFWVPALLLAWPQFAYFAPQVSGYSAGFMRWQPGWVAHVQNDNWIWFWIKNIGGMVILIPIAWWHSFRKNKVLFWSYLPFVLLFVACNLWIFQPWENDNTKLLRFWYLASAVLVAAWMASVANKGKWQKIGVGLLLISVTLSGAVDAGNWLNFSKNKLQMWGNNEIQLAEQIKVKTAKNSVFLTTDAHNHWVVDLAGRKIVMGFRGWLWSWGINYSQRERDVQAIFRGDEQAPDLLAKYGVDYVVIGYGERETFGANETYFKANYPLVLDFGGQEVFDVRR